MNTAATAKHPFDYHRPSPQQVADISDIREGCKQLYDKIVKLRDGGRMTPREAAVAITNLEQVSMWGNKAVILADEGPVEPPRMVTSERIRVLETPLSDAAVDELARRCREKQ